MNLEILDVVTLEDDNEYVVNSKVEYEGKTYYYLRDINDIQNFKFCYEKEDSMIEFNNTDLSAKLLPLFVEAAKDYLPIN